MIKNILTLLLLSAILSNCGKSGVKQKQEENYDIVLNAVEKVTKPYNKRNEYILDIYASLSKRNRDSNFVKLEKIKLLSAEISKQTPLTINNLEFEAKKQDSVKIFIAAIDYLKKTNSIEPFLPIFYNKIKDDILEIPTQSIDTIINLAEEIRKEGLLYKKTLQNYRDKNKLFEK